ncbi:MAG: threonylcarbamoyl-AMP synthase [Pirellula sp.]|nr:threonylcarbamoyl-AMP synthase [Pirellula sp.]
MKTVCLRIHDDASLAEAVDRAAKTLRDGGVVAFPTETVYGLGANALDAGAVARIFAAKGRPSNNPLIVHTNSVEGARRLCATWPEPAAKLAEEFWPGPLTMVLPKAECIPSIVTAGGPTVALRMPRHPVARALIEATQLPLAAPSANLSTRISAVRAEHVLRMLDGRIEMVLDGGQTPGGLESTVVDLTSDIPRLLRPGLLDSAALEAVLGRKLAKVVEEAGAPDAAFPSPGMLKKHYAPLAPVRLVDDDGFEMVRQFLAQGFRIGWMPLASAQTVVALPLGVESTAMPNEPVGYAARLYEVLHALEIHGVDQIVIQRPPMTDAWQAVHDRLQRAAARDEE